MLKLNSFKQQLVNYINSSQLTIEEVYYVLKDLFNEVTQTYNEQIIQYQKTVAITEQESVQRQEVEEDKKEKEE